VAEWVAGSGIGSCAGLVLGVIAAMIMGATHPGDVLDPAPAGAINLRTRLPS
jgi:hypothetical protein